MEARRRVYNIFFFFLNPQFLVTLHIRCDEKRLRGENSSKLDAMCLLIAKIHKLTTTREKRARLSRVRSLDLAR